MTTPRDPLRWLPAAAIAATAWLALFPITSVDAYYHLAVGKRILDERAIPARGVGSATFGDAPWHDNEWGFQALAAAIAPTEREGGSGVLVLKPSGRAALVLLRALCLAGTLALLDATMALRGVGPALRAVGVVLAALLTFGNLFWDVRPQILSYLALAATGFLLERDRAGGRWAAPGILAVVAAWSNVHAVFVVGIALVGAEAVGELIDGFKEPSARRRGLRLLLITALAPLAACLNPHGWLQVAHPFLYVLRPEIHAANAEWEPPDFLHLPLLVLTVAAFGAALALAPRRRFGDIVRAAAVLALFLTAIRHLPLVAIVVVPLLCAALAAAASRGGRLRSLDLGGPAWGGAGMRLASVAVTVAAIAGLSGAKFVSAVPRFEERMVRPMPERAVRFLAREGVEGAGFNAYRFGGFLMFRLYPQERVFMDGRNDLYGTFRSDVFTPILETRPGWRELWREAVERRGVRWVLVDAAEPLAAALRAEPGWIEAPAGDDGIALFLRDTPDNRERAARSAS